MRHYLRVYRAFVASSVVREMEFRANFFAKVLGNLSFVGFFVLVVVVVYGRVDDVAGWSRADAILLTGTVIFVSGLTGTLTWSLIEIPQMVRQGTLDFVITRPIDSQFWVSTRRFHLDQLGSVVVGALMIAYASANLDATPGAAQWLGYLALLPCAALFLYSFNLLLMTTGIWFVRVDNLFVLSDIVLQVSRFPLDIYSFAVRYMLTYFFPLAFLATIPAKQLTRGFDAGSVAVGVVWALVMAASSRWFWRFALSRYTSASS